MENKKQYCILCGAENQLTDKFCHKCGESLDQKDDELQTYAKEKIKGKVKDEVKGKVTDGLLDLLKKFLNSKAYGIILSLSVVAGATGVLAGGSGVKEFSNNVPGMFSDGTVYGMNFSGQEALESFGGINVYPGYDADGNISLIYLAGSTHFSRYTDLTVTSSGGKQLIKERIQEDERGRRQFCYVVEDLNATVEIVPTAVDGSDTYSRKAEILLGTDYGIRTYREYEDDLTVMVEYYDSGIMKYQLFKTQSIYADIGDVYGSREIYYDEMGRVTLDTEERTKLKDTETYRTEYTYYENGDVLTLRWENDLPTSEWLSDADGNCLRRVVYLEPGELGYTDEYTYYDNGQVKTEANYGRGSSDADMLSMYAEYYEDGSKKLRQSFSNDGNLYTESIFNQDGTGQTVQYSNGFDDTHYVQIVYEFYTDEYNNYKIAKETSYREDGSVRHIYTYDESGNRTLVQ